MKVKIIYSMLFVFAASAFSAQDTVTIYFNKDGIITDKAHAAFYRKGVEDKNAFDVWKAQDYFVNSNKIRMTGTYTNGKLNIKNGYFVYFSESGSKEYEGGYLNNLAHGLWRYWHENGSKQGEGMFKMNKREGKWTYWYDNRLNLSEGECLNDQRDGKWKFWNEKGELDFEEYYQNGRVTWVQWYYDNGTKRTKGYFTNKKRSGEWTYWDIDGKVFLVGGYLNGEKHGEWTRYFENAQSMNIYFDNGIVKDKKLGGIIRTE